MPLKAKQNKKISALSNTNELPNFLSGALMWRGSVTPRILPTLLLMSLYPLVLVLLDHYWQPLLSLDVTPFEYTGAVLGLVLVFRTNAGHDRWWEARKLWGGIVNQSRNLAIQALNYGCNEGSWSEEILKWVVSFPFATKESLRGGQDFSLLADVLSSKELDELANSAHKPLFVANKMAELLQRAVLKQQLNNFAFAAMEKERMTLIDHIGGCERILRTPMPLVYAIKTRRFIFLFLFLLPLSLIEKAGFNTITIFILVAYPLLALDRIGIELQNPFSLNSLSHLPLDTICETIKNNCLALKAD